MQLRKSVLMAKRDYLAAVLTKGFVIGLALPVILGLFMTGVGKLIQATNVKRVAIIDDTRQGVGSNMIKMEQLTAEAKKTTPALAAMPATGITFETADQADRPALVALIREGEL